MDILKYSNPLEVQKKAEKYLGKNVIVYLSNKPEKKYMIEKPDGKVVYFGQMGFEDFTKHKDQERRQRYLRRTENMRGNWRNDPYSANNLSRNLLW
jgi:hypothetical protein